MLARVSAFIVIVGAVVALMSTWPGGASVAETTAPDAGPERVAAAPASSDVGEPPFRPGARARPAPQPLLLARAGGMESPRREFERSEDLFAFLQWIEPQAAAGDADARWLVSRVHEYCGVYARAPLDYQRDTGLIESLALPAARPLAQARGRVATRCRRFVPADDVADAAMLMEQRRLAALAGSLAAEAALLAMGEPLEDDPDYRVELVDRVQASRDPEAFVALAPAMGLAAAGDPALDVDGQLAGDLSSELAWQLAGCELGQDCAPTGALMTAYCANGGVCARGAQQDFPSFVRETALSRRDADAIDDMVDALVRGQRSRTLLK